MRRWSGRVQFERTSVDEQDVLGVEEVEHELFVVDDSVHVRIDAREGIQTASGFVAGHSGNLLQ